MSGVDVAPAGAHPTLRRGRCPLYALFARARALRASISSSPLSASRRERQFSASTSPCRSCPSTYSMIWAFTASGRLPFGPVWWASVRRYPPLSSARCGGDWPIGTDTESCSILLALMGLAPTLWLLIVLMMIQGALTGTIFSAQALIASSAPEEETGRAMGMLQMSVYAGATLGPVAGGMVAQLFGYRASFIAAGMLLAIATVIVFLFVTEPRRARQTEGQELRKTRFVDLFRSPVFIGAVAFTVVSQLVSSAQFPILPLFVQDLLHGAGSVSADTGWLLALSGMAAASGSYLAGRLHKRHGLGPLLMTAAAASTLVLLLQALAPSYLAFLALRSISAFSLGALFALVGAWAAASSPPRAKGAAFGIIGAASSLGFGIGPLLGGVIVSLSGIRSVFVFGSALLLIASAALFSRAQRILPVVRPYSRASGERIAAE